LVHHGIENEIDFITLDKEYSDATRS
jgi:hypothetical protein